MPRSKRHRISQDVGSVHIISRVAGGGHLLKEKEKEFFLKLLEKLAAGFFVKIHAFCIMDNHFHILATGLERDAAGASKEELFHRYQIIYGDDAEPPAGSYDSCYQLIPDADGGVERLRRRLGSISRFVQELKQSFSRWYNKHNDRIGYLWGERFKGVIVSKGEAQLACSSYIDLNPVRAGIVNKPEEYGWSSLGIRFWKSERAHNLLYPLSLLPCFSGNKNKFGGKEDIEPPLNLFIINKGFHDHLFTYLDFVYKSGGLESRIKSDMPKMWLRVFKEVKGYHGKFGVQDRFRYRTRNISEGIAVGNYELIADLQRSLKRKNICPRSFIGKEGGYNWSYTTRVLRV